MRTRTKWIVAGGAAGIVLTPLATVYGSTPLDEDLHRGSVVVDGAAANRARAARTTAEADQAEPTASAAPSAAPAAKATPKASKKPSAKAPAEPDGKKTVSAASPVSPQTAASPVSPN